MAALGTLVMSSPAEQHQLRAEWNDTRAALPGADRPAVLVSASGTDYYQLETSPSGREYP